MLFGLLGLFLLCSPARLSFFIDSLYFVRAALGSQNGGESTQSSHIPSPPLTQSLPHCQYPPLEWCYLSQLMNLQ